MADMDNLSANYDEPFATRNRANQGEEARFDVLIRTLANCSADPSQSKIQALIQAFSELIERGYWRPGDRLPTEKQLSQKLKLSVGTVQSAMRALQNGGLIERSRRSGTFVSQTRDQGSTIWYFRFRTPDGSALLPWETTELSVEEVGGEGEWSRFLADSSSYIRISRLITIGNEFPIWSDMYIDGNRFEALLKTPKALLAGKNLRVYFHERFNAPTFRAVHRISHCEIGDKAAQLGCVEGEAGMRLKAMSYSYRDTPISFHDILIPPNRYELEVLG